MRKDWFEDDNEIRLLHRGKRRLLDIVFGRTMVITLLLVLRSPSWCSARTISAATTPR